MSILTTIVNHPRMNNPTRIKTLRIRELQTKKKELSKIMMLSLAHTGQTKMTQNHQSAYDNDRS